MNRNRRTNDDQVLEEARDTGTLPRDMSGPTVVAGTASKQDVMKAYAISEEEYDEIKRDFDEMDADKSGFVDGAEIAVSLKKERGGQAQSDEEVAAALKTFDSDADGKITFLEYVGALGYQPMREKAAASAATVNAAMRAPLEWVFEQLDDDGSGFIEEREGLKVGKWLGGGGGDLLAFWTKMKADMDTDGDEKISKEEFVTWMGTKGCLHPTAALQLKDEVQSKLNQAKLQQPYPKRLIPSISAIAGKDEVCSTLGLAPEEYDEMRADFDAMDADRSGVVDKSEIAESLKKERGGQAPSAEDVAGMLAMLDMDGDGKVTFIEYVTALAS